MHHEPREAKLWIRGVFQLPTGRHAAQRAPARTVRRDFIIQPDEEEERAAIVYDALLEELQTAGYDFAEGHGALVQILGSMSDVA